MPKRSAPEHPELKHPSTKRAKEIDANAPYEVLNEALGAQDKAESVETVAHWFRSKDLRIHDNKALHHASELAKTSKKPLISFYLDCPSEFEWHGTSPARVDFLLENLRLMQKELKDLGIPLVVLEAKERKAKVPTILDFLKENKVSHVFANYEYEVDELRRDIKFLSHADNKYFVEMHHDQTVMEPGSMTTGAKKPMRVFTPYHSAWLAEVKAEPSLIDISPTPSKQDPKPVSSLFDKPVPCAPENKRFASKDEEKRIRKLWPAGHSAGIERLNRFTKSKLEKYADTRSNPGKDTTSRLSAYFSAGVISVREALAAVRDHNDSSTDFTESGASHGVHMWVRELVFRELYRQTTVTIPHISMNLPQNLKFDFVKWEDDEEGWKKWCSGHTGMPLVDAGMRQLNHEAYMHNRARMNVSSYLYCNLLLDFRRGERYFAEHLIDWDLSNNTQGWEPSYTVFNPVSQAERNDPDGAYIRRWIPELKDVEGKAVFDPAARLPKKEFEKLGYPYPHVDWKETKARCMEVFKRDMHDAEP